MISLTVDEWQVLINLQSLNLSSYKNEYIRPFFVPT